MEKYKIISNIIDIRTSNAETKVLAEFDEMDEAKNYLSTLYQNSRMNSVMKDVYCDGLNLTMNNSSAGTYSSYKINKVEI